MFNINKAENIIMSAIMKAPRTLLDRVTGRKSSMSDRMVNHFASQYETLDEHVFRCGDDEIKELYLAMTSSDKRILTARLKHHAKETGQVAGIKVDNSKATYAKPFLELRFIDAFAETIDKIEMRAQGFNV